MGVEYPPAIDMFIDDPAWVFTDALQGVSGDQLSIIIHKTACNGFCRATDVATFFHNDTKDHKSVHFIVGRDGSVIQVVRLRHGAGGNCCVQAGYDPYWDPDLTKYGNLNKCTISIEHEDWSADNSQAMPQAQIDASFALVKWLCQKFSIPASHIKTHASQLPSSKARCPGPTYPLSELLAYIQGGEHLADLANFPLVNQRTMVTFDGRPSENEDYNCVVANLVACIFYFHPEYIGNLSPDAAKDAVLGEAYKGGMDIGDFISWVQAHGVTMQAFVGSHASQVAEGHRQIQAGNPVICTGFDPYSSDPNDTHVYTWHKEVAGGLVALDPFGLRDDTLLSGKDLSMSDAAWADYLRAGECWIVTKGVPMLQYTEHARDFSTWYTAVDANHWKCKQTGQIVQFGIKAFYQQLSLDGQSLPLPGLPLTNEVYVKIPTGQIILQVYERAGIVYDQNHLKDKPPGMGAAYLVKLQDQDFLRLIPGLQLPTALPEQVMKDIQAVSAAVATLTKDAGV